MNLKTESINKNFSSFAKLLHWGFVILFLYGLLKQIDSINQLEDDNLLMFEVIFALAFLLLLIIRFVYMKTTQQSSIPDHTPKSQKLAAKIVHYGMYICLALIPFSGLIIGWLFWLDLKDGFLINLVIGIHEFAVSIIYWLIGFHIVAATYHRLKKTEFGPQWCRFGRNRLRKTTQLMKVISELLLIKMCIKH